MSVTLGDWIAAAGKVFDGNPATFGGYALSPLALSRLKFSPSRRAKSGTVALRPKPTVDRLTQRSLDYSDAGSHPGLENPIT